MTLELRGRLTRRDGVLFFETSETGQKFEVQQVPGGGEQPPEKRLLEALAILAKPQSADRIILQEWKDTSEGTGDKRPPSGTPAQAATAELLVRGMT